MLDKMVYNTILSQTLTPCGKYLVAGNIYGQIAVFDLDRILNPVLELLTPDYNKPKYLHTVHEGRQVNSLASTDQFIIIGTVGEITGYTFKSLLTPKLGKPSWSIKLPAKSSFDEIDINSIWLADDEKIFVGCGDNNVYGYSLEDGSLVATFKGHEDYVHCVHGKDNQIVSSGEDGSVKLWDMRTCQSHNSVEPHTNSKLSRPDIGKWVGSVALGNDWIVCGGGPRLALWPIWQLKSQDAVTVFDLPDHGIHVSTFHEDCVVAAGATKHLYQLTYDGKVKVEIPVAATTVYSTVLRTTPNTVMAIAGSSSEIDLCTSFNYKDQVLHFR